MTVPAGLVALPGDIKPQRFNRYGTQAYGVCLQYGEKAAIISKSYILPVTSHLNPSPALLFY